MEQDYYRLELDDYSTMSFISSNKYYFGTLDEIRALIQAIGNRKRYVDIHNQLLAAFRAYEAGQTDVTHIAAFQEVPFLVPAKLLHTETVELNDYAWEHLNTWELPYYMRCDRVRSEHLWLACEGKWFRAVKAEFSHLRCEDDSGQWEFAGGEKLWGLPCMLSGDPFRFYNMLAEPEKSFQTKEALEEDWTAFKAAPDPDYTEFCDDIFGNG